MHTITTASGIPIIKIKTIECENPLTEEKRLLEKYKDYRVYGEWLEGIDFEIVSNGLDVKLSKFEKDEYIFIPKDVIEKSIDFGFEKQILKIYLKRSVSNGIKMFGNHNSQTHECSNWAELHASIGLLNRGKMSKLKKFLVNNNIVNKIISEDKKSKLKIIR
jgi:hypothetical protein